MPIFTLNTNVKHVPGDVKEAIATIIETELHKPMNYIAVHVNPGQDIYFGGSCEQPSALCELSSIGGISPETNAILSKKIIEVLEKKIGVTSRAVYIIFKDLVGTNVGWNKIVF